ncbi:MAG TPA: YncE family protein [Phycisphaerae bacterium]|nr:YncE family protein [Phycisphaerae bacterium]
MLSVALMRTAHAADTSADGYTVVKTIHVGGIGGWDYINCDPTTHRIFFTRQSHTQVLDTTTGQIVADIPNTMRCHGVALALDVGRGYVSDSDGVTVFDLNTGKTLGTIAADQGSDGIIYDPASKCVVVMNGRSEDASFIDTTAPIASAKAINVPLGGRPEFAAADGMGRVYINIESASEVAVIDSKTFKLIAIWKIGQGDGPSGMSIDPSNHLLFVGCHNQIMPIIDTQTGQTVANIPIGRGIDACGFNPTTGEAFASCGDGTLTVVKETSPGKFSATSVKTIPGARTMTVDISTGMIYLPDAEIAPTTQPAATQAANGGGYRRNRFKPDSFMIVVVGKQ